MLAFWVACEPALPGGGGGGGSGGGAGKGRLKLIATTSLEFEYLHRKGRCQMLIGGDDNSNDVITLSAC